VKNINRTVRHLRNLYDYDDGVHATPAPGFAILTIPAGMSHNQQARQEIPTAGFVWYSSTQNREGSFGDGQAEW